MPQRPAPDNTDTPVETTPSILVKAFAILDAITESSQPLTLSQLARSSGLSKSTAHRVIRHLLMLGTITRHGDGYRIGPRVLKLAARSVDDTLLETSLPHMRRLHEETEHTLLLSRRNGAFVSYLEQMPAASEGAAPTVVGRQVAALSTPEGRTLLAHSAPSDIDVVLNRRTPASPARNTTRLRRRLSDICARGAVVNEISVVEGLRCACVPVLVRGTPVLAVSLLFKLGPTDGRHLVKPLHAAAKDIAQALENNCLHTLAPVV